MATGRIFKITKEQAGSYELLKAPRMRRARANPGVTAIMGISNPSRSAVRNQSFPFIPRPGMVLAKGWVVQKVSPSLKRVTIYLPQDKDYGPKLGRPLTYSWDEKTGNWRRQGKPLPSPQAKGNLRASLRPVKKTEMVGGIRCLAKPAKRRRRQGLTEREHYALPQCFRYPVQTKTGKPSLPRIRRALSYYGRYKSRYSKAVRTQIERGIAMAARDAGLGSPKAMEYRSKFGLANPGEDSMIVMRKNAARKKPRRQSYRQFSEFVVFPARGKSAKGVSGYAGPSYKKKVTKNKATKKKAKRNPPVSFVTSDGRVVEFVARDAPKKRPAKKAAVKKKPAKKVASKAKAKRIVVGPEPKNKNTKAWRSWRGRRGAAIRAGQVTAKKAPAKKRATKKAPSRKAVTATPLRDRTGSLKVRRVSKPGSGRFGFLEILGGKKVSVKRGLTSKKRGKTVKVAVRNINGKSSTWYKNKTKAVANLMRRYAMRNPDAREAYWAEQGKKTAKPKTREEAIFGSPAQTRAMKGSKSWADSVKTDSGAAAVAAATGVAPQAFATVEDFEKWLTHMFKTSPKFKSVYGAWLRKKYRAKAGAAKKVAKKKAKKMVAKKTTKKRTAKKNVRKATKKPRTTRTQCKRLRGKGKPSKRYMSCISRLRKTGKKAAARRPAAKRKTTKRRTTKRRVARRNRSMKARANQMFARVTALAKPTAFLLGGIVAHRMLTNLASKFLEPMVSTKVANVVSNIGILALGAAASQKVLPANASLLSMGMAVDAGLSIIGEMFPAAKQYLGLGILTEGTRARYVLNGFGQPILQAAAGMGQPILQAAAGPVGEYYDPMGEYVSNDVYPSGGDFGEYVASNLDVQGYGDYEVEDTYGMTGGGYMDDGVRPDGDLGQEFAMMEAKAGVGQPIMQAAAGLPSASTYLPHQQAGMVRHSESSYDAGIFDIGGGNGVLS